MIDLFREISEEFDKLKEVDFIEPPLPFDKTKYVFVADMSENLKKLFTLYYRARRVSKDWEAKIVTLKNKADKLKAAIEANKSKAKEEILEGIFWYAVCIEHPLPYSASIAVTKGFKVVKPK